MLLIESRLAVKINTNVVLHCCVILYMAFVDILSFACRHLEYTQSR